RGSGGGAESAAAAGSSRRRDPGGGARTRGARDLPVSGEHVSTVREAMVRDPGQLPADASAQAAGELLQRPEVRAVFVTEGERLVGVVTRQALVREGVAEGLNAGETHLGALAEPPRDALDGQVPLQH